MYFTSVEIAGSVDPDSFESDRFDQAKASVEDVDRVRLVLNEEDGESAYRCQHCNQELDADDTTRSLEDGGTECTDNPDDTEDSSPHVPVRQPLTWANSATIAVDEEQDSVTVSISASDPRGAFAMTITRLEDGRLFLHVPYEGMSSPHMQMKQISDGTFELT